MASSFYRMSEFNEQPDVPETLETDSMVDAQGQNDLDDYDGQPTDDELEDTESPDGKPPGEAADSGSESLVEPPLAPNPPKARRTSLVISAIVAISVSYGCYHFSNTYRIKDQVAAPKPATGAAASDGSVDQLAKQINEEFQAAPVPNPASSPNAPLSTTESQPGGTLSQAGPGVASELGISNSAGAPGTAGRLPTGQLVLPPPNEFPAHTGFPPSGVQPAPAQSLYGPDSTQTLEAQLKNVGSVVQVGPGRQHRSRTNPAAAETVNYIQPGVRAAAYLPDNVLSIPNSNVEVVLNESVQGPQLLPKGTRLLGAVVGETGNRVFIELIQAVLPGPTGERLLPIWAVLKDADGAEGLKGSRPRQINYPMAIRTATSVLGAILPGVVSGGLTNFNQPQQYYDPYNPQGIRPANKPIPPLSVSKGRQVAVLFLDVTERNAVNELTAGSQPGRQPLQTNPLAPVRPVTGQPQFPQQPVISYPQPQVNPNQFPIQPGFPQNPVQFPQQPVQIPPAGFPQR